jgi:hypothetical protein
VRKLWLYTHPPTDTALLEVAEEIKPWQERMPKDIRFYTRNKELAMLAEIKELRAAIEAHKGKA